MEFIKLTLDCMEALRPFFTENASRICDCTTGGTFMWREYHNTEYALEDGTLYLRVTYPLFGSAFAPPQGAAGREAYERIVRHCAEKGVPALLCAVSEGLAKGISRMFPDSVVHTDRAWSDYL